MADRDEMARPGTGFADWRLPADGGPLAMLSGRIGRSLIEAGLSLHRCEQGDPLYPLGGVCLTPVPDERGGSPAGISVSWTTHNVLLFDASRWATYSAVNKVMNSALGTVLSALGYEPEPFGTGGAWIVPLPGHQPAEGVVP